MIDEVIEARPEGPAKAVLFFLVGVVLVVAGFAVPSVHFFLGAVMPVCLGVALLLRRRPSVVFHFSEEGIAIEESGETIPYEAIESLSAPGRPGDPDKDGPKHYPIQVIHEEGTFHIPAHLNVRSDKVFRFLLETFPVSGSKKVNKQLRDYLDEQLDKFGEERVFSYRARSRLGKSPPSKGTAVSLAIMLCGLVWGVLGFTLHEMEQPAKKGEDAFIAWGSIGLMLVIFGGLFALLFWLIANRQGPSRVKGWKNASLVISPLGMALIQGDLKGEMHWDELQDVKYNVQGNMQSAQPGARGILLLFKGASVPVADVYDRPLNLIYQQIRNYWKPRR